jgi:hypothetical protein
MYANGNETIPSNNFIPVEDPKNKSILCQVYRCTKSDVDHTIK